jgi:hypothetical protein
MLGRSAVLSSDDRRPPPPSPDQPAPSDPQTTVVARLDEKSRGPHPMTAPDFPFPVRIFVDGRERPGTAKGNLWVVPLRKGEVYEIYASNRSGDPVCMRLLVDGLNTLPDLEMAKTKGVATLVWGQHVNLADARHFVLDPTKKDLKTGRTRTTWRVSGFVTKTGEDGELREFVVASADQSLAAKRKFTDNLGMITAAFYDPTPRSRGPIGTDAGKVKKEKLTENAEYVPGNLRAVVNIHYVDPDDPSAMQSLETPEPAPPAPPRR